MKLWLVHVVDRHGIDAALQKPVGTDLLLHTADKLDRWANEKMTRWLIYYYGYTIHPCGYRFWNISRLMQKLMLWLKCNVPEVVADIEKRYEKLKADVIKEDEELQLRQFKPCYFPGTQFFVDERHLALSLQSLKYQAGIFAGVLRDVAEIATSKVETRNAKETTTAETERNATPSKRRGRRIWLKNHPHSYGLQGGIIFLVLFLSVGLFKPQWRQWCWGVAGLAFLALVLSLLGGRSRK